MLGDVEDAIAVVVQDEIVITRKDEDDIVGVDELYIQLLDHEVDVVEDIAYGDDGVNALEDKLDEVGPESLDSV